MAQTESKYEQFPVLFDNGRMRIYKNHCDEIFVEDIASKTTIRLNSFVRSGGFFEGLQFTTDGRVEPVRVSNLIGWRITRR